jgi:hypothetical protein
MVRDDPRPAKITFGEMQAAGVVGILVYCADYKCTIRSRCRRIAGPMM